MIQIADSQQTSERLRADARRNRDQIVAAAGVLFREEGVNVPMEEIARRAGVGVGTLYRRFPDRAALIQAVAVDGVQRLIDLGFAVLEEEPDAWSALSSFLHRCVDIQLGVPHSALDHITEGELLAAPDMSEAQQSLNALYDRFVRAAQAEGALRRDFTAKDFGVLVSLLVCKMSEMSSDLVPGRFVEIMLDGLRVHSGTRKTGFSEERNPG